jgi:hypothetical protein
MNLTLPVGGTSFHLVHTASQGSRNLRALRELHRRRKKVFGLAKLKSAWLPMLA